ncbi:helix-turn-helix transcriptional regulator [Rhizobium sp. CRRU65]|uniref:helix-turn-helix transcriptional regulator n=1 Tax=Rhizobium sp. CRRU65 TaxID=3399566 RepID=UPI003AF78922
MDSLPEIMIALRAARSLLGLSQEELADVAGVSRQIVVRIEKADGSVLVDAVTKVRVALETQGIIFLDGSRDHGPGVTLSRKLTEESSAALSVAT